jgi:HK97 family phage major capsid protein
MNQMPDNLMQLCDQYTVTGESLTFPANAETSRATGSRYGGVRGYWIAEATQITSSIPTVRRMKLEPQELAVLVYVTDKLLNNATAMEQYIRRASSEEIMFLINDSIINGNGVGQPTGIKDANATISIAAEVGQEADTILLENVNKMYARCHARARANAIWFINQDTETELERLSAAVGTGGVPVYLPVMQGWPNIADAPQKRLKGLPVRTIEYCDTLGNKGDIILANLGYYALGVRGGVSEAMSMHLRFDYAETAFRFMFAVDGQSWLNSAITPFKGTATLSPFLTLAAR